MAERWRIAAGNWSNPAQWDGGVSVPDPADDCYLNNFAVTLDVDVTVASIRALPGTVAVAGGTLTISTARTLVADLYSRNDAVQVNGMVIVSATSGTVTITSNMVHGPQTGSTSYLLNRTSNCNLVLNGSCTVPSGSVTASSILMQGTGTVSIGSSGTPFNITNPGISAITINNASIVGTIYVNELRGNANSSNGVLNVNAVSSLEVFTADIFGGTTSGRYGFNMGATSGTVTLNVSGATYAGNGGSSPVGVNKTNTSTLILNSVLNVENPYNIGNAVAVSAGTFTLNADTPRDVVIGSAAIPIGVSGGSYTLNIDNITRVTQNNQIAVNISGAATGTMNFVQAVAGGSGGSAAAFCTLAGTGNHIINAPSITGGGIASCPGLLITNTTGTITINANVIGGEISGANGVNVTGIGGSLIINGKAVGNGYGVGSAVNGAAAGISVTALKTVSVREVVSGPRGQSGIIGPVLMQVDAANQARFRQAANGTETVLVPSGGGGSSGILIPRSMSGGYET